MKKGILIPVMLFMLLEASIAMASGLLGGTGVTDKRTFDQDGMTKIETLAIADSIYSGPNSDEEPEKSDLADIIMEGTLKDEKGELSYISYRDIASSIRASSHVDILRLDHKKAFSEYKKNIALYADAYVVTTVSNGTSKNDGTRLNIFFEVYDAKTHKIIYAYRKLAPKTATRDTLLYTEIAKDFFKDFLDDRKEAIENAEKEKRAILKADEKAAEKAAKEARKNQAS